MEDPVEDAVVDGLAALRMAGRSAESIPKKRRESSDFKVTAFQAPIAMPDLLDPQTNSDPSTSDPSTSDPSTGDDTSPSSFLGTPYSTKLQFDYPFPISNAPRDPTLQATPLPSTVLSIATSLGSAPSMVSAAVSSEENSDGFATSNPLPSLVSSIAASPDLPVNNNLSDLRSISNMSTSSLNSTHSGHTAPGMGIGMVVSSSASIHSIPPPSSSLPSSHHIPAGSPPNNTTGSRHKGRHSLSISPMPPPALAIPTSMVKPMQSPPSARRTSKTQAQMVSLLGSTGSDLSHDNSLSNIQSRPTSGSVSSLSITSLQLLTGPGEPPIPPSLLNKLGRPRNTSTNSNTSSYFTTNVTLYKSHNSRDFFGSPVNEAAPFASAPNSPPPTLGTDSSVDVSRPLHSAAPKSGFSAFRPALTRSNTTSGPPSTFSRPFFGRSNTAAPVPNPALQSRAYAQHLRHQQEQQLKLQEEQRKKAEKKEKKEKKKEKSRRSSLSLSRSVSSSSSSSAKTRASSSSKSPQSTSSSSSQADGFKLSPSQRSFVENALDESEGSTSPEGSKKTKVRRRSSVRRALEKTGSLVGFNLNLNTSKRGGHH